MNSKNTSGRGGRLLLNLFLTALFGLIYFYFKLPAINLHDSAFYVFAFLLAAVFCLLSLFSLGLLKAESGSALWKGVKQQMLIPVLICALLGTIYLIGSLISAPIFRANAYQSLLRIEPGDFQAEVEQISYRQIPMLDADSAARLGDKKMGELADMVSQFDVADEYAQINYRGKPYRVSPLRYNDFFKWISNRSQGLPAYIMIDMVTQDADAVRLEDGMKYTTDEYFFRNVSRRLRFLYSSYIFDKPVFEVDDEGKPYWVCPRVVKKIGLFGGTDIDGLVLMDAVSGDCVYYDGDSIPAWVDRAYSASLVLQQYDYHGMYQKGWLNSFIGQKGVTVVSEGYNYIAKDNSVYLYTGVTSVVSDNSNLGFVLTNLRTKETRYYPCAGASEYASMASAEGIVQYMDYEATFPLLLNISGQPTYFMALKDSAGLVKMYAMVNVAQYQLAASGTSLSECERSYVQLLAENRLGQAEPSTTEPVKGKITDLRTAVLGGNTHVFLQLDNHSFYYVVSVEDSAEAAILSIGNRVELSPTVQEGTLRSAQDVRLIR